MPDLKNALSKKVIQPGQTLTPTSYAAALQSGNYCTASNGKPCGDYYTSPGVNSVLSGAGLSNPGLVNPASTAQAAAAGGATGPAMTYASHASSHQENNGATSPATGGSQPYINSALSKSIFGPLIDWISKEAPMVGLVVLFAILAIVVFISLVRPQVASAAKSFVGG